MKKLFIAAAIIIAGIRIFAQAQPATAVTEKPKMAVVKKDSHKAAVQIAPAAKSVSPASATGPNKKDGTPDRRYKTNKVAAKPVPAGPTKKDGSADMRYKANKAASKKKAL